MASGADRVVASLVASSDQRSISDFTRVSQRWPTASYASKSSFCVCNIASVGSLPVGLLTMITYLLPSSSLGHARTAYPVRKAPAKSVGLRECTACRRHGHAREFIATPALCPFVSRAAAEEPTPLQRMRKGPLPCPLWVIRVDLASATSPLIPTFRTSWAHGSFDAMCH